MGINMLISPSAKSQQQALLGYLLGALLGCLVVDATQRMHCQLLLPD